MQTGKPARNTKLRRAIRASGRKQKEIASEIGITDRTMSRIINLQNQPRRSTIRLLCQVLRKDPQELGFGLIG